MSKNNNKITWDDLPDIANAMSSGIIAEEAARASAKQASWGRNPWGTLITDMGFHFGAKKNTQDTSAGNDKIEGLLSDILKEIKEGNKQAKKTDKRKTKEEKEGAAGGVFGKSGGDKAGKIGGWSLNKLASGIAAVRSLKGIADHIGAGGMFDTVADMAGGGIAGYMLGGPAGAAVGAAASAITAHMDSRDARNLFDVNARALGVSPEMAYSWDTMMKPYGGTFASVAAPMQNWDKFRFQLTHGLASPELLARLEMHGVSVSGSGKGGFATREEFLTRALDKYKEYLAQGDEGAAASLAETAGLDKSMMAIARYSGANTGKDIVDFISQFSKPRDFGGVMGANEALRKAEQAGDEVSKMNAKSLGIIASNAVSDAFNLLNKLPIIGAGDHYKKMIEFDEAKELGDKKYDEENLKQFRKQFFGPLYDKLYDDESATSSSTNNKQSSTSISIQNVNVNANNAEEFVASMKALESNPLGAEASGILGSLDTSGIAA